MRQPRIVFISGTNTEVGKTYIACRMAQQYRRSGARVGVYKPVASDCYTENGTLVSTDAVELWESAGKPRSLEEVCPQRFIAPLAPPSAARREGKVVDASLLASGLSPWLHHFDHVIIEGAGGLFSPLADGILNIDLFKQWRGSHSSIDLLIVTANRLGVIHHTLATIAAAKSCGVTPDGIILNDTTSALDESSSENADEISRYTDVPILERVANAI